MMNIPWITDRSSLTLMICMIDLCADIMTDLKHICSHVNAFIWLCDLPFVHLTLTLYILVHIFIYHIYIKLLRYFPMPNQILNFRLPACREVLTLCVTNYKCSLLLLVGLAPSTLDRPTVSCSPSLCSLRSLMWWIAYFILRLAVSLCGYQFNFLVRWSYLIHFIPLTVLVNWDLDKGTNLFLSS